jgi:hypothetical protein
LQQGKVTIEQLLPETVFIWQFDDGLYKTGLIALTESESREYSQKRRKQKNIKKSIKLYQTMNKKMH